MNRISIFRLATTIVQGLLSLSQSSSVFAQDKPKILFITSDDHTTQAIGAYQSRLASLDPTPNIDALAKNGMRFDRVFCNNSICTPNRASILTGQYSQSNGVLDLSGSLPPERRLSLHRKTGFESIDSPKRAPLPQIEVDVRATSLCQFSLVNSLAARF